MRKKPVMTEGEEAFKNFESGMKKIFQVPKSAIKKSENTRKRRYRKSLQNGKSAEF